MENTTCRTIECKERRAINLKGSNDKAYALETQLFEVGGLCGYMQDRKIEGFAEDYITIKYNKKHGKLAAAGGAIGMMEGSYLLTDRVIQGKAVEENKGWSKARIYGTLIGNAHNVVTEDQNSYIKGVKVNFNNIRNRNGILIRDGEEKVVFKDDGVQSYEMRKALIQAAGSLNQDVFSVYSTEAQDGILYLPRLKEFTFKDEDLTGLERIAELIGG